MSILRTLLLGLVLLSVQFALAAHGIEHAFHDRDEACIECLALPGMLAMPAQAPHLPPALPVPTRQDFTAPPAPTFALHLAFRSRAPPPAQSR